VVSIAAFAAVVGFRPKGAFSGQRPCECGPRSAGSAARPSPTSTRYGETYQAQTINYRGSVSLGAAVRTVQRYRSGRQVTVYYDPEHPHIAVLERGATFGGLVRVVMSALLVWVGLRVFYGGGG
jgi:hypothetical protein